MNKPKVGDELTIVNVGNKFRGRGAEPRPCFVMKVGIKYFYVAEEPYKSTECRWVKFSIDRWVEVSGYTPNYSLYKDLQTYLDETERRDWQRAFRDKLSEYKNPFTLEQYRQAAAILNIKIEDN